MDAMKIMALATLTAGQPQQAVELLKQVRAYAHEASDYVIEKLALNDLGLACSAVREHAKALRLFEQALVLARHVGDRRHEAKLLWHLGIEYAELGQRDTAIDNAQAAVNLLGTMDQPEANWLAGLLEKYRAGDADAWLGESNVAEPIASPVQANAQSLGTHNGRSASLLRMAISAAGSMAKFVRSGMKTAPGEVQQQRLQICAGCEQHTGLRCRACGCFTRAKALLPHENCPLGKWPAVTGNR
jgi:tetratricopeptide (TPR) repeat protein